MRSMETSHVQQEEQLDPAACWELLERVADSPHLRRASRLRELLLFVGQRFLKDGCDHVPEQEIGVKVFGRQNSYDNANDSIVRTTISELRKRIEAYFATEGLHEPIVMEIPRGVYTPVFYNRNSRSASAEDFSLQVVPEPAPESNHIWNSRFDRGSRWVAGVALLSLAVAVLYLWRENRQAQQEIYSWRYEPAISSLWSGFLDNNRETDVVMEDSSVLLLQLISKQNIPMSDYINKTYLGKSFLGDNTAESSRALLEISRKTLGKVEDFRVSLGIRSLAPGNPRLHFYNAREYTVQLLQNDNVILLGNPTSNPWLQWFENSLNFTEVPHTVGTTPVSNRSPKPGENAIYTSHEDSSEGRTVAHCAIAYLPKPDHSGNMLLIQGTTSEATEAGGQFLLSEDRMAAFAQQLHVAKIPYFEALLHVSQVLGTPVTAKVEAYRTYPDLH
jgi:hypothetical protein